MGFPLFMHRAAARALAPGGILPRQVTEENLGFPLFISGEPERSEGNLRFASVRYKKAEGAH